MKNKYNKTNLFSENYFPVFLFYLETNNLRFMYI